MYSKAEIFNLALGALLLQRRIVNADTDTTNEAKVLQLHFPIALKSTLEDMDLDSTSSPMKLELITQNDEDYPEFQFIYKYPTACAFFRRIRSRMRTDNRSTHIPKRVGMYGNQKAIFTDAEQAVADIVRNDIPLTSLSAMAGMAVAYRLALLSSPLITGKGAEKLVKSLEEKYVIAKTSAQEQDRNENFNFDDPEVVSEFVEARMS